MQSQTITRWLIVTTAIIIAVSLSACRATSGVRIGERHYDGPHHYYYYPDARVYFDIDRKLYFYYDDGRWKVALRLPEHIHIRVGKHVRIKLDSSRPYRHHEKHRRHYPPGHFKRKYKRKHKYKEKRGRGHKKWKRRGDDDYEHPGRGRGQGRGRGRGRGYDD